MAQLSPQEHYDEAMRLVAESKIAPPWFEGGRHPDAVLLLAEAQVYASLFAGLQAAGPESPPS